MCRRGKEIKSRMKKYLFFDLDGTLTDPMEGICKSAARGLAHFGIEKDYRELTYFIGPPLMDTYRDRFGMTQEQAKEAVRVFREYFVPTGIYENKLYPGIPEMLQSLKEQGKVRVFGVSNHNPMQIELLNQATKGAVKVNQIQFSVAHCPTIDAGLNVNMYKNESCDRDGSVLEYCRLKNITVQAWSPFQYGMFEGIFIGSEKYPKLNEVLNRLAETYDTTPNGIAVAWILRHPAGIQTIVGTMNEKRLADIAKAADLVLTREEWYELYMAAGKMLP